MLQSTYDPKVAVRAKPAGFALFRDAFRATPLYLFVAGAGAALEKSVKRR